MAQIVASQLCGYSRDVFKHSKEENSQWCCSNIVVDPKIACMGYNPALKISTLAELSDQPPPKPKPTTRKKRVL